MTDLTIPDWHYDAKCSVMDPDLFDVDSLPTSIERHSIARQRCQGCIVIEECRRDALDTWNRRDDGLDLRGVIRAGIAVPASSSGNRREQARLNLELDARQEGSAA